MRAGVQVKMAIKMTTGERLSQQPTTKKLSEADAKSAVYISVFGNLRRSLLPNRKLYGKALVDGVALFDAMDRDANGSVSHSEFKAAMKRLGLFSDKQVRSMLDVLDQRGNGFFQCSDLMYHLHGKSIMDSVRRAISSQREVNGKLLTDARAAFDAIDTE